MNAQKFDVYTPGCVIALKRGRVTDYYGEKSIDSSCLSSSTFKVISSFAFSFVCGLIGKRKFAQIYRLIPIYLRLINYVVGLNQNMMPQNNVSNEL